MPVRLGPNGRVSHADEWQLFPFKLLGARNKAENLPPHPPAIDDSPRLPIEVIDIVLSHLRGDHHILSRCMRVSTKVYEVAAPHLYYDIVLQDPKYTEDWMPRAYPNGTVFHGFEQDQKRIVPTKRRLMQHIKHVTVRWSQFTWSFRGQAQHTAGFTWSRKFINTHFPTFDTPLEIDTMCISIPHCFLMGPSGDGIPKTPPEDAPSSYPYLALWERFRPKKIILFGTLGSESILWTPTYPPLRRLPAGLETLVTHFDCANAANYNNRYNAYRGCQTLRKLVYIISDAPWEIQYRHLSTMAQSVIGPGTSTIDT